MVSDPIGDFIIQLKNASAVKKERVVVNYSKMLGAIADKLKTRGLVKEVEKKTKKGMKMLEVELSYRPDGPSAIEEVNRLSKPGRRLYGKSKEIMPVRNGRGVLMISTPGGVMTGEEARKAKLGGELLFTAW